MIYVNLFSICAACRRRKACPRASHLSGSVPFEFRTTVVAELHDDDSFHGIGAWIRGAERYYLQPFTDRETVPFQGFHTPDRERLNA